MNSQEEQAIANLSMIANALLRVVSLQDAMINEFSSSVSPDTDQVHAWELQVDKIIEQLPINFPDADTGWQWNVPPEAVTS